MSDHKKKSPSKFERLIFCPGSQREEERYPNSPSGAAAIAGTNDHTLLETCINDGLRDPEDFLGQTLKNHEGSFVVTKDMVERIQVAVDYLCKRKLELGFAPVHSEVTINSMLAFGRDDMGGTCDIHITGHDILEVADYKGGMGPVDLPSVQLDIYTILILNQYDLTKFKTVRQTIIQPKLAHRGEAGIIWIERPAAEVMALTQKYAAAAAAADAPDAPLYPGEKQCKYCKHKGACSALLDQSMQASGISFANLDVAQQAADKEPTTMDNAQIKEILEAAPLIRQMLEGVEKEALRRFNAGQPIAGLKLVRGRGSRSWSVEDEVEMADKLKRLGMPKSVIWQTKLISVAQAEKAKWQKRDGSEDQLSPRQLKTLKGEYIKQSDGKLSVVSESDEREAVIKTADHLFGVVEAEVQIPSWLS